MCRFVVYLGPPITLSSLVTEPSHSIIHQSYKAVEREEPLNGDGFGVAWYAPELSEAPAVFKDVSPAWNNQNLLNLAPVVESECLLAHVRAATPGLGVSQFNCHPFAWGQLALMHNGEVAGFAAVKRALRRELSDEAYAWIKGSTDSEHLFALFLDEYARADMAADIAAIREALLRTIRRIEALTADVRGATPSNLNLVVADGDCVVVTRYSSDGHNPNTLYIHSGGEYTCRDDGTAEFVDSGESAVLIASEPLTDDSGWERVGANQVVTVDAQRQVVVEPIAAE